MKQLGVNNVHKSVLCFLSLRKTPTMTVHNEWVKTQKGILQQTRTFNKPDHSVDVKPQFL